MQHLISCLPYLTNLSVLNLGCNGITHKGLRNLASSLSRDEKVIRVVARTLIGGGGCIFIYSGSARLTSFEINFISKETSRAEPEYMNIHPPISALVTALKVICKNLTPRQRNSARETVNAKHEWLHMDDFSREKIRLASR